MSGRYDDIMDLPHHISTTRLPMSMTDRAAQFSPFAALTGYDDAIRETGRLTDAESLLSEDALCDLDLKFHLLAEQLRENPTVHITYFRPDDRKKGGAYITVSGIVKKIDLTEQMIRMADGLSIPMAHIADISFLQ